MLSFLTVCKRYHFCVIIFPYTGWVLSFMLSFNVIIFCYLFPPFFFFLKTWHTPRKLTFSNSLKNRPSLLFGPFKSIGMIPLNICNFLHLQYSQKARMRKKYTFQGDLYTVFPWSVHIFPAAEKEDPLWEYINRSQTHKCENWDCGRAIPFLRIYVSNFRYCFFALCE